MQIKKGRMNINDVSLTYRQRFLKNQLSFNKKYKAIFDKIADDFSQIAYDPNLKFSKSFVFPPYIKDRIKRIITDFDNQTLSLTEKEIEYSWDLSNSKNDQIVKDYIKMVGIIKASQEAKYYLPNLPALKAFISGDRGSGTLSDAIWKVGAQYRSELETHLGIGILQGDSAQVISRRIRSYLSNPDVLFRRIRDNNGRLVASQAMIEFRKANGLTQGVYTSAYKNAMRVARTNTNQAFLLADHIRWMQLDMVKGIRISLSEQHPDYNFPEICEVLEGDYPKTFIFVGFHPQCLCHATPILESEQDFMEYLKTGRKNKGGMIKDYPQSFIDFWKANFDRFSKYKSMPFVMADNLEIIKQLIK